MSSDEPKIQRRPDRAALVIAGGLAIVAIGMAWSTFQVGGVVSYTSV